MYNMVDWLAGFKICKTFFLYIYAKKHVHDIGHGDMAILEKLEHDMVGIGRLVN